MKRMRSPTVCSKDGDGEEEGEGNKDLVMGCDGPINEMRWNGME